MWRPRQNVRRGVAPCCALLARAGQVLRPRPGPATQYPAHGEREGDPGAATGAARGIKASAAAAKPSESTMPFVRALLLYIAAAGVGEALLAGAPSPAVGLQSPPHALLPGYQIVLPFPAGGAAPSQYSASPPHFQSALFSPLAHAVHPYSSATAQVHAFDSPSTSPALHPFVPVAAAPLADNYVESDGRSAAPYAVQSPVARSQHASSATTYYAQDKDLTELGRVGRYQDAVYAAGAQSEHSRSLPHALGRSRSFHNSIASQAVPSGAELADPRFQSNHQNARQYQIGRQTSAEFGTNSYQASRQSVPEISERRFPTVQQPAHDYRLQQYSQHPHIVDNQHYQNPRVDESFSERSLFSENFGSYGFPYSNPNGRNALLISEAQRRIQQDRYNIQRANVFGNTEEESLQIPYIQRNAIGLPLRHDVQVLSSTSHATQPQSSLDSVQPGQAPHLSYRVDVAGNGYGYRYAVQSSHNPDIPKRQAENIVTITPPSLHAP